MPLCDIERRHSNAMYIATWSKLIVHCKIQWGFMSHCNSSSKFMSHCDMNHWLCHIVTCFKDYFAYDMHQWLCKNLRSIKVYLIMQHKTMPLSHCNKHESWLCIVTFNKVLCWIVMCIKVHCKVEHQTITISHCDIH